MSGTARPATGRSAEFGGAWTKLYDITVQNNGDTVNMTGLDNAHLYKLYFGIVYFTNPRQQVVY
jgi:hypothetical protein